MVDHDDRDVNIGGSYDDVVGVSNIIYALGVEADAGVCFGVVETQYVNGLVPHYTIFNVEVATFIKMANTHMAFVYDVCVCLLFHSFSRNIGNSLLNDGDLSASLKSAGRVCCGPIIL